MGLSEFFSQSSVGIIVCTIILGCVIGYICMAKIVSDFYKKLISELNRRVRGGEQTFNSTILNNIYGDFSYRVRSGIENVNTGAIIERHIPLKIAKMEWTLNYFVAMSIVLGLFGTFLGLTGALNQLKNVLVGVDQLDKMIEEIANPVKHIATAFIGSISGIGGSIVMNLISLLPWFSYRNYKNIFYCELEDFLDNETYGYNAQNYNAILVDFTDKVEESMRYMTDKVTKTFDEGIDKFANKINGVSFDITESAKTLVTVISKLESSVNIFNKPVLSFKESVDNFRLYYEGLDNKIKEIDKIAFQLISSFERTVNALDHNNQSINDVGNKLRQSTENLTKEHEKIMTLVEKIGQYTHNSDEQIKSRVNELSEIYKALLSAFEKFKNEVDGFPVEISRAIKDILKMELHNVTSELDESVNQSFYKIQQQNHSFKDKIDLFGETINAYGKLLQEVEETNQSSGYQGGC